MTDHEDEETPTPKAPTPIASDIRKLKEATLAALGKRDFVPQPLFWSLFHSELDKLRRERARIRKIEEALSALD